MTCIEHLTRLKKLSNFKNWKLISNSQKNAHQTDVILPYYDLSKKCLMTSKIFAYFYVTMTCYQHVLGRIFNSPLNKILKIETTQWQHSWGGRSHANQASVTKGPPPGCQNISNSHNSHITYQISNLHKSNIEFTQVHIKLHMSISHNLTSMTQKMFTTHNTSITARGCTMTSSF
jgi:hypothetical protein